LVVSSDFHEKALMTEVDLLVDFVNTRDVDEQADALADPAAINPWFAEHTEIEAPIGAVADPESQRRLLALRESLRDLLRTNAGEPAGRLDLSPLREAAAGSRFHAGLSPEGLVCINADGDSVGALEGRLLLAMELVQTLGAWPRIKACAADSCQWAFYDTSRNRSRTWCSMEECGNREKTRRYRSRKAAG
jgi:predicted RNA-binding Zn ribbon-like protein